MTIDEIKLLLSAGCRAGAMSGGQLLTACAVLDYLEPATRPKPKVAFIRSDDWEAMFVDGKLVAQDHDVQEATQLRCLGLQARSFLDAMGYEVQRIEADGTALDELLYEKGQLDDKMTLDEALKLAEERL